MQKMYISAYKDHNSQETLKKLYRRYIVPDNIAIFTVFRGSFLAKSEYKGNRSLQEIFLTPGR